MTAWAFRPAGPKRKPACATASASNSSEASLGSFTQRCWWRRSKARDTWSPCRCGRHGSTAPDLGGPETAGLAPEHVCVRRSSSCQHGTDAAHPCRHDRHGPHDPGASCGNAPMAPAFAQPSRAFVAGIGHGRVHLPHAAGPRCAVHRRGRRPWRGRDATAGIVEPKRRAPGGYGCVADHRDDRPKLRLHHTRRDARLRP